MKDWEKTLKTSLKERLKRYRRALARCQKKFSEKSIHASRVETRRLLSLVELLNVFLGESQLKKIRRILKRHLDVFNPLRDTQVQLLLLAQHRREFPETARFRCALIKREKRCRKTAAKKIGRLDIHPLQKVFRRLERQLAHVRDGAAQRTRHRTAVLHALRDAFARTLELQRAMDPGNVQTIHRTRLAFKKFRYMTEALQPLFAEITSARLAEMQEFQSEMGELQDTEVLLARLDHDARRHQARAENMARFRYWLLRRHTAQIARCLHQGERLRNFWPLVQTPASGRAPSKRARPSTL